MLTYAALQKYMGQHDFTPEAGTHFTCFTSAKVKKKSDT
jgi:hypothetical protein